MLAVISCFFNPTNSTRLKNNYLEFRKNLNHPVTTVELAFDDQPFFIEDSIQIRGTKNNLMWQKERLLNIALDSLPNNFDKVAWLDADIIFENHNWFSETEHALEFQPVVQLFESSYEFEGSFSGANTGIGFAKFRSTSDKKINGSDFFPLTGLAWAARREVLNNGFFDLSIIGSGDLYQITAWLNDWNSKYIALMTPKLRREFLNWALSSSEKVQGDIGYVKGKVRHLEHGSLQNRNYYQRHRILIEHEFCPVSDIALDRNGLYAWNTEKTTLPEQIRNYFYERNNDG